MRIPDSFLPARLLRELIGITDLLYILFLLFSVSVIGSWVVLASCVDPNKMLPVGTTIVGAVYSCVATYKAMIAFKNTVQEKLQKAFDLILQVQIKSALDTIHYEQVMAGKTDVLPKSEDILGSKKKYTASDVFLALSDSKGKEDGTLTMPDIEHMFRVFDLQLNDRELERFFAYCDADASGDVTVEEFQAGFDEVFEDKLLSQMAGLGITLPEIIIACILGVLTVGCLGTFIIAGMTVIAGAGTFQSLITSLIIGLISNTTAKTRARNNANTDGIVEAVMAKQGQ